MIMHTFDCTVDEGNGRLTPSRDKNRGKHRRRMGAEKKTLLCDLPRVERWLIRQTYIQE